MYQISRQQYSNSSDNIVRNYLKEGKDLKNIFDRIKNLGEDKGEYKDKKKKKKISTSQARKLLELARDIKEEKYKDEILRKIIKMMVFIDYQQKRGKISQEIAKEYISVLNSLHEIIQNEVTNQEDIQKYTGRFYDIIEIITVYLSSKEE